MDYDGIGRTVRSRPCVKYGEGHHTDTTMSLLSRGAMTFILTTLGTAGIVWYVDWSENQVQCIYNF